MAYHDNLDLADLPNEEWRAVPGWEECYAVSNMGRVKSLGRTLKNRYSVRATRDSIKKQTINNNGYLVVALSHPSSGKSSNVKTVHSLVAKAFLGTGDATQQVQHLDGDKCNNAVRNLAYATVSQILLSASARGTQLGARGGQSGTSKLTENDVREIRRLSREEGISGAQLARNYGISGMTISHILRRKLWKHVE